MSTDSVNLMPRRKVWLALRIPIQRHPTIAIGGTFLFLMLLVAIFAPWLGTLNPRQVFPLERLQSPSISHWFGTDMIGRDLYSRTIYGTRVSLIVGFSVAALSTTIGLFLGLMAGFQRVVDSIVMRFLDGFMAIPPILFAIALMTLTGSSLQNVIIALTIPEIPRVARLIRSLVLSLREQPFVEAAVTSGASFWRILLRHILPHTTAALVVQGTYVFAAAILLEAGLSFLGVGTPPDVPSWGNIMAEGRVYFQLAPQMILFPGFVLALTMLAVIVIGDGLRDALDPRLARQKL